MTIGAGVVRPGRGITLIISNEDMDDSRIIESLENLGILLIESVKQ